MKGTFSQKEQISFIGCTRPSSGCLGSRRRLAGCSLRPTSRRRRNRPENKKYVVVNYYHELLCQVALVVSYSDQHSKSNLVGKKPG